MPRTNRRRWLAAMLGAGGSLVAGGTFALRRVVGRSESPSLRRFGCTSWAMGSQVAITVWHGDRTAAHRAMQAALAEVEQVERVMSLYRTDSQICRLNRDGALSRPHPYLFRVLRLAENVSRRSSGAFDITVQPLWIACAAAKRAGEVPSAECIGPALSQVGWRRVTISPREVRLDGKGTAITLNGIAQGFAADRALETLRRHGISRALVDTGEIGPLGTKDDGPWTAGIQHPRDPDAYLWLAPLEGRCLSTSGDYATSFSEDHAWNHLFDPRTGRSPRQFASVSVVAPTAAEADAWSTAFSVMTLDESRSVLASLPSVDALFVLKDGQTLVTDGFPKNV